ncbi:MAG: DUF1573 domain-containing protein [Spirochaetes bacterium]|nr:DUF1573 domain-containing protein [Spirochaetota bacterium]
MRDLLKTLFSVFLVIFLTRSLLAIEKYTINLGNIQPGKSIKKVIILTNRFNTDLAIETIAGDCECLDIRVMKTSQVKVLGERKAIVPPHREYQLLINIRIKEASGEFKKRVLLKGKIKGKKKIIMVDLSGKVLMENP